MKEIDISRFTDNAELSKKVTTLAPKAELRAERNKIVKLKAFDSSYF